MDLKNFNDLAEIGSVRKTVKLGSHSVVLHTLNSQEYSAMAEKIGDEVAGTAKRFESLQREMIIAAIESIDGEKPSYADKASLLGMMQIGLSNMLYEEYGSIVEEQSKIIEESKKNSAPAMTGSAS
jgi:hypothetical protein